MGLLQLWGTVSNSNIEILQRFQNKILRIIVDALWYVTNDTLHQDVNVPHVRDEIRRHNRRYADRMKEHPNIRTKNLMRSVKTPRRLKRRLPQDLCTWPIQFYRIYVNGHILYFITSNCHMYMNVTLMTVLRILQVSDSGGRLSEERVCTCTIWNVPTEQYVYNFDRTLERTAFFEPDSGLLSCCHTLAVNNTYASADVETAGNNRFPLRTRKRVQE